MTIQSTSGNNQFSAGDIMSLFDFMNPSERNRRVFSAGELLNDQGVGSAHHTQQEARVAFNNRLEGRTERQNEIAARKLANQGDDAGVGFESRQLQGFQIPTMLKA